MKTSWVCPFNLVTWLSGIHNFSSSPGCNPVVVVVGCGLIVAATLAATLRVALAFGVMTTSDSSSTVGFCFLEGRVDEPLLPDREDAEGFSEAAEFFRRPPVLVVVVDPVAVEGLPWVVLESADVDSSL